jgi:hypothetical protein
MIKGLKARREAKRGREEMAKSHTWFHAQAGFRKLIAEIGLTEEQLCSTCRQKRSWLDHEDHS